MNMLKVTTALLASMCVVITGCSHQGLLALSTHADSYSNTPAIADLQYSWALPKTTFDVDATWTFKDCSTDGHGSVVVNANVDVKITPHAIPDSAIGWVYFDAVHSYSFWQDHTFDVKTAQGTHLLQSFNSTATDQTGTILGNILGGVAKIADIASVGAFFRLVVPGHKPPGCGALQDSVNKLKADQYKLKGMLDQTTKPAKSLIAEISTLQQRLVIKLDTLTIDPVFGALGADGQKPSDIHEVGKLQIPLDGITKNGWVTDPDADIARQFELSIQVNFSKKIPPNAPTKDDKAPSAPSPAPLLRDALFREVVYMPVEVWRQEQNKDKTFSPKMVGKPTTLPFAQFGASRTLPLDAPNFGKASWTIAFNDFGEITDASWGSQATGVGISQVFLNSMTTASTIAADQTKAPPTDKETLDRQAENTRLQAIIDNANKLQQCQDLMAKGQVKSCQ